MARLCAICGKCENKTRAIAADRATGELICLPCLDKIIWFKTHKYRILFILEDKKDPWH